MIDVSAQDTMSWAFTVSLTVPEAQEVLVNSLRREQSKQGAIEVLEQPEAKTASYCSSSSVLHHNPGAPDSRMEATADDGS